MSFHEANAPACTDLNGVVELRVEAKEKNLGEFTVRRVLPSPDRQMVGPFIFFDHMGPADFAPGEGIQVRPHPHIGIATITYLFEGEIMHRDSLGCVQPIEAGAVNLMTAGRGIVHSERAGSDLERQSRLHGIQSWMALPEAQAEIAPAFVHYPADQLPRIQMDGADVCLIIGEAYGHRSPVAAYSPMLYLECQLTEGATLTLPDGHTELGVYVVSGDLRIEHMTFATGVLAVARNGATLTLEALQDSRIMVLGGDPVGERLLWWNFVASGSERIERAKEDWRQMRFDPVPGDAEFIPLPPR